jgi:predicted nuclease of restriction endonuclease-like (RecB) superfamily
MSWFKGLSRNKKKLSEMVRVCSQTIDPTMTIRDHYVFDFLGLKSREVMGRSHLEDHLPDKLQEFLLEPGNGFCFEARQKGIEHEKISFVICNSIRYQPW